MSNVNPNEILEMFFKQIKPFGAKKQTEFRDAFSLLAIRSALKGNEKIYVISSDPDHKAFCKGSEQFISIDTLSALLDLCYKHIDKRGEFVVKYLQEKKDLILEQIKNRLEVADAFNTSTWEDAEVNHFQVIDINGYEPEITHLDSTRCMITFDITVKFKVEVSGPDLVNSYYDREDDQLHTFGNTEREEEVEKEFPIIIDLYFETDEGEFINDEYNLAIIGLHKGIEFDVEETPTENF